MIWSHFDLAILYNALYPLREDPSTLSKVSYSHYATPLCAKKKRSLAVEAYGMPAERTHRGSAAAESAGKSYAVPSHVPSSKEDTSYSHPLKLCCFIMVYV